MQEVRRMNESEKRIAALVDLDIEYARGECPLYADDKDLLMWLHKERVHCKEVSDELREESREWLNERGFYPSVRA
jgi:hypothetical protein